jgi:hypothetical protein
MRHIMRLHQVIAARMNSDSVKTLRKTAWQIEEYLEEHGKFIDAEFLRALQKSLEKLVQRKTGTKWTVELAKRDLRGRTIGVNQFARNKRGQWRPNVEPRLAKEIDKKLVEAASPDQPSA